MGVALYMEHAMGLEPCNLCILQRVAVIATALVALFAGIHGPNIVGIKIYASLGLLTSLAGAGLSGRQLWLQSLPADQVPACGPSLDYLVDIFPLTQVLSMVLEGDGDCAEVVWSFLGISIPGWTLVGFFGLIAICAFVFLRPQTRN
ncbi:MAG: disulfide bond formation protein DsbB [Candidatus Azotimanducaceae bacterium]|jgi:disulfide bond formation protein DsbB